MILPALLLLAALPAFAESMPELEDWSLHAQSTVVSQEHRGIHSPYSGALSLSSDPEFKTSFTATLFLGRRLWEGAEAYVNPELSAGSGLSGTHGVAGFPNGEIYRVDTPSIKGTVARLYLKQIFGLSDDKETIEGEKNQLATEVPHERFTLLVGKFSLNDFFDDNTYSHDPRTQFLNWSLMDNGAWDYAADTRGYTYGIYLEYNQPRWALRFAAVLEPKEANQLSFDRNVHAAHGLNSEFEYRYELAQKKGKLKPLVYLNQAHMGRYSDALSRSPVSPDVTQTRDYRSKFGFGLNWEQALTTELGVFSRLGWNDGATETWAFTEVDRTFSMGVSLKGDDWKRNQDTLGTAFIINGLSRDHADYLSSGGFGFLIGDGHLNYAPEQIWETYYLFNIIPHLDVSADFQLVNHPAYNADRGPVSILGGRLHYEF